jgi:uncharacterized membrane protein
MLLGMAVLSAGLMLTTSSQKRVVYATLFSLLVFSLYLLEFFHPEFHALAVIREGLFLLFFARVIQVMAKHVFVSSRVSTANRLYGSISIYLMLGAFFANIYLLISLLYPTAFSCSEALCHQDVVSAFRNGAHLYYSIVTLTTVGYGDITPVHPMACMVAAMEALIGQMYVAVVVARLVGLHLMEAQSSNPTS